MPTSRVGGPAPTTARLGRELQRYSQDGERLLAGCIPVRATTAGTGVDGIEALLITSSGGKGLVFPKGGWETDETVEAAAARETVEEAGVRGSLEEPLLGTFPYFSGKIAAAGMARGRCIAHMFAMRVAEELPTWPEGSTRQRVWCSVPEAMRLCRHDWMREALRILVARRGWQLPPALALNTAVPLLSNGNGNAALGGQPEAAAGPAPHAKRVFAQS